MTAAGAPTCHELVGRRVRCDKVVSPPLGRVQRALQVAGLGEARVEAVDRPAKHRHLWQSHRPAQNFLVSKFLLLRLPDLVKPAGKLSMDQHRQLRQPTAADSCSRQPTAARESWNAGLPFTQQSRYICTYVCVCVNHMTRESQ